MKKHWTPRYIYNRVKNYYFEKNHQHLPWLTPDSIKLLDNLLKKTDTGVEFGSGRSTVWLASKCNFLTSIEDHEFWYNSISKKIKEQKIENVNYLFKNSQDKPPLESDYFKAFQAFKDNSLDFVLIDGKHRGILSLEAINKIKTGGLLIIDNIERYIPYQTHAPHSIAKSSNTVTKEWTQFIEVIKPWREIKTSNGVSDTSIYIKTNN